METKSSACPLDCPDLCSLEVTTIDGKVTKVQGSHVSPITNGFVCSKVRNLADHLYCDERILTPLIRTGPKGTGAFREASWDEALERIVERYRAIIASDGAEAILPYHYGGSNGWLTEGALAGRFFRRLGASRLDRTLCAAATGVASRGMYGVMPGVALEDYEHAKLIVIWGANPSATSIHMVPVIERALAAGAKLVVVDPRRTPLAKRAHIHIALQPGSDLPVALSLIAALEQTGADRRFLREHCTGSDELFAAARQWTFAATSKVSGVDAATLAEFYQLYRDTSNAVIRVGWGPERNRNGGSAIAAILALPAVAGKFGVVAGGYTMSNGDAVWNVNAEAGINAAVANTRLINMSEIARVLEFGHLDAMPPLRSLFVYNCNPIATAPNQAALIRQLEREDLFVVVHDQVMTDTAALADVVLPATAFVEHRELRRGYGTMRMYDSPAVATPVGQAWSNNQLFGALLSRMGLTQPEDPTTDQEIVDAIFAAHPAGTVLKQQLRDNGVAVPSSGKHPIMFVDVFPSTPDRKIALFPEPLARAATHGLYQFAPDPSSDAYPLALISPALATQISSTFGQLRSKPAVAELSFSDAQARGIRDGDSIVVKNHLASLTCVASLSRDVKPGVVVIAKGYWRKHSKSRLTANALIPEVFADLGGQAAFNDARVQVELA